MGQLEKKNSEQIVSYYIWDKCKNPSGLLIESARLFLLDKVKYTSIIEVYNSSIIEGVFRMDQTELQTIFRLLDSIYMKMEKSSKETLASNVFNNLTIAEAKTILAISNKELKSMKQIAEQLCIAQNTATVAVERLIAKDIAIKEPSVEDRRQSLVRLTSKGIYIMAQIDEVSIEQISLFLSPLSEVEIVLFKNILEKFDGSI